MKRLIPLALLLVCFMGNAQRVKAPATTAPLMPPELNMPAGKIYIDAKTIPRPLYGFNSIRVAISCGPLTTGDPSVECGSSSYPYPTVGSATVGGSFRTTCAVSHYSFDDPIVWPGQAGRTHLHGFFGNTSTDAQRDASKMDEFGRSTCSGGTANRTGYWTPVWVYHCPLNEVGCSRARDGEVQPIALNNAYYKNAGGQSSAVKMGVTWWPKGFRMIQGDPNNANPATMPPGGRFDCSGPNTTTAYPDFTFNRMPSSTEIMTTAINPGGVTPCNDVNMLIGFPDCSIADTSVLYLPTPFGGNRSAHVAPGDFYNGCTNPDFPHMHPALTFNVHTKIKSASDHDYLVLSSDRPARAGVTRAGSTTTAVVLAASEWINGYDLQYGFLSLGGERRQISAYDGTTKVATVSPAFTTAPSSGVAYLARPAAGRTMHGDWANGWDQNPNFMGWGRSITDQIIRGCYHDTVRFPTTTSFDCHDNNLGDPLNNTLSQPRVGTTYYWVY